MTRVKILLALLTLATVAPSALKPTDGAITPVDNKTITVFKTTPQGDLKMNLYFPKDWKSTDRRPAIVFFFGGGFVTGTPAQFTTKAEYFASRGMVAATAEYRIGNKHHTPPEKCIEDAKSAVRWLRVNARNLGVDPTRVVAAGGSAGGTDAAFAAYNTSYEPDGEDMSVSSKPDALVLYNPALGFVDTTNLPPEQMKLQDFITAWKVTKGGPPAILFFGTDDNLLAGARIFVQKMIAAGNRAELYTAAGQKHGFFNDRGGTPWHAVVLRQTDLFLSSLGFLKGQPAVALSTGDSALTKELP
jgi:acetyl esterase/lipase